LLGTKVPSPSPIASSFTPSARTVSGTAITGDMLSQLTYSARGATA
jgi:hypothetical protein